VPTYVALLYSISLPSGRLRMDDWRAVLAGAGMANVRTLIATGNAVFETDARSVGAVEHRLEDAFERAFGRRIDTIVRSAPAWRRLVAGNPFPDESAEAGDRVAARVMRRPLAAEVVDGLAPYATAGEQVRVVDGDLWISFAAPPNPSRLLPALTTRRLGVGTIRNWNTLRRLGEMLK
jgi:uncharacterized protein (DUF1697 family)